MGVAVTVEGFAYSCVLGSELYDGQVSRVVASSGLDFPGSSPSSK